MAENNGFETIHPRIIWRNANAVDVSVREGIPDIHCTYVVQGDGLKVGYLRADNVAINIRVAEIVDEALWDRLGLEASRLVITCFEFFGDFGGLLATSNKLFPGKTMMRSDKTVVVLSAPKPVGLSSLVFVTPSYSWVEAATLRPMRPYKSLRPFDLSSIIEHEGRYFSKERLAGTALKIVSFNSRGIKYVDIEGCEYYMSYGELSKHFWWNNALPCMQEVEI